MSRARRSIDLDGLVQGVGFRPFVHGLALRLDLAGLVQNRTSGVHIEIEGEELAIDEFMGALERDAPPRVAIDSIVSRPAALRSDPSFSILPSDVEGEGGVVPADFATCGDCLAELVDSRNRRFGHPFITCTRCGPRATIVVELPYDRHRTTMSGFPLCAACQREYDAPEDRRFHAQPIACPDCGPRLRFADSEGRALLSAHPLADFADAIVEGRIGALKGIGGFHLVCDAANESTLVRLRERKRRDAKPFAVMVTGLAQAEKLVTLGAAGRDALSSAACPVVLAQRRADAAVHPLVAPGVRTLGVLLPYAPVHHLLLAQVGGRPLVFTSGNPSDSAIAHTDEQAFDRLSQIADVFLTHDRPIRLAMEDSVVRSTRRGVTPVRRSRGHAPLPIEAGFRQPAPTLALGGHLKAVFGFGVGSRAVLGPHFGDLDGAEAFDAWRGGLDHMQAVLRIRPARLVYDLHPDYASTRYAEERLAREPGLEGIPVQHHHAHLASCMAEHRLSGDVIGVCFDGTGYGLDGTLWGGEFLVGGYSTFERAAHLSAVRLPGGDRAAREPWRVALAHLVRAGVEELPAPLARAVDPRAVRVVDGLVRGAACPLTTSMGRLFDAVAALAGLAHRTTHEGEAAMRLEACASTVPRAEPYPFELREGSPIVVDVAALVRAVAGDSAAAVPPAVVARRFHQSVVELVARTVTRLRARYGLDRVVLTGGVFVNAILADEIPDRLEREGFRVFTHRVVPPNDGGLALGQLAVAAHRSGASAARGGEGRNH